MSMAGPQFMTENIDLVLAGLERVREAEKRADLAVCAPSVAYLRGAIDASSDSSDKCVFLSLLAGEYIHLRMPEEEEGALKAAIEICPNDSISWIALSSFHLVHDRYSEARREAEFAVELSEKSGEFRRHALQTLARCLRKLEEFGDLEVVVRTLITLKSDKPDSVIENDFLMNLPSGAIDEDLVRLYTRNPKT